jgi:hypothetical protein
MRRRIISLLFVFTLLSFANIAQADDPTWTAWLHYGSHMTLIDSNGAVLRETDLPLPDNNYLQHNLSVSPDSKLAAYIVHPNDDYLTTVLTIYDTANNHVITEYTITGEYWMTSQFAGTLLFSDSSRALAFGYGLFQRENLKIEWHILVFDTADGRLIYSLDETTSSMSAVMGTHANLTYLAPFLRQYTAETLTFTLELLETEGNPKSFTWNTATGGITLDTIYPNLLGGDRFTATGEVVMPVGDDRFPGEMWMESSIPLPNTLHVYDPVAHGRYPFYVSSDLQPLGTKFVQNGERILMETWVQGWFLIERDSTVLGNWQIPTTFHPDNLTGTPDGFVYTAALAVPNTNNTTPIPAIFEVDTRDNMLDMGHTVWSMNVREFQSYFDNPNDAHLDIAWVHSDAPIGPFMPWAQLAEPIYSPAPEPTETAVLPTPIPPPAPIFQAGHQVRTQTIDGEILNLRTEPTRASEILVYIEDDTNLLLLEGPVSAEGYSWWRVRTPDGLEGWVVENDGELQTLIPI